MPKFPINLKQFKKIHSDKLTTTLKHAKDGHEIKLAHNALSPEIKTQLDALPVHKFNNGGLLSADEIAADASNPKPTPYTPPADPVDAPNASDYGTPAPQPTPDKDAEAAKGFADAFKSPDVQLATVNTARENKGLSPLSTDTQTPDAQDSSSPTPSASLSNPDPYGFNDLEKSMTGAYNLEMAGKGAESQALAQQGKDIEAAQKNAGIADQAALDNFNKAHDLTMGKEAETQDWLNQNPLNSQRYVQNMSTGSKVGTAIALLAGGLGAGLTHGPNMAAQYLQHQIDQDVDAQKNQIGVKNNLLTHYMQEGMNEREAYTQTRLTTNQILQSQLGAAAGRAQTAEARGALLGAQGMLMNNAAKDRHDLIMQRAQAGFGQPGQSQSMSLEALPAEKRERVVQMPDGGVRLALTKDGAKDLRSQLSSVKPIFDSLDQLGSLGASALIPGSPAAQKAEAIRAQLIPLVNENAGLKRLSGEDIQNINKMFTDPSKFSNLVSGGVKTQQFKSFLQDKLMSNLGNELEGGYKSSAPAQAQSAAPEIKTMNGVRYQKVPGGWKKV